VESKGEGKGRERGGKGEEERDSGKGRERGRAGVAHEKCEA